MVVVIFISDKLVMNRHDDVVYLDKPTSSDMICTLPTCRLLGTVAATWPDAFDVDRSAT